MGQITVTIAGRVYRMACGDGEEARLEQIAGELDVKIAEMRRVFGEIGDMRLQVMAALTFADELVDMRARLARADAEKGELEALVATADERQRLVEERIAEAVVKAAERVERLARAVAAGSRAEA